jgi:hypothetical protein
MGFAACVAEIVLLLRWQILDVGESYCDQVKQRPVDSHTPCSCGRGAVPRLREAEVLDGKLYWLKHNYRITAAVFRAPSSAL